MCGMCLCVSCIYKYINQNIYIITYINDNNKKNKYRANANCQSMLYNVSQCINVYILCLCLCSCSCLCG